MTLLAKRPAVGGTAPSTFPIGPLHATTLAEAIQEFVVRYGGEWRCIPMETLQAPSTQINIGTDAGGGSNDYEIPPTGIPRIAGLWGTSTIWGNGNINNAHLVFEFGTRRGNVASYSFNVDRQQ